MSTPKRDTRLLFMIVIALSLLFVLTYAGRLARKTALDAEITRWESKIEQSKEHQFALEAELRYVQSDAYVEKLAHDEFGMVKPGESLVVIVPAGRQETVTPIVALDKSSVEPLWHRWLSQLGLVSDSND